MKGHPLPLLEDPTPTPARIKALHRACHDAGLRLEASRGEFTAHLYGRSVPVALVQEEAGQTWWELGACPITEQAPVTVPVGEESELAQHLSYRLRSQTRRRRTA